MEQEKSKWLRLDLQTFAEVGDEDPAGGAGAGEGSDPDGGNGGEEKLFTQSDLERMLGERLARDRKKREDAAEAERAAAEGEYKKLYELILEDKQALESKQAADELDRVKTALVIAAGYDEERVEFIKGIVTGETEEELKAALDAVIKNVPPTTVFADPNLNNGGGQPPRQKTDTEYGKELFDRIKRK